MAKHWSYFLFLLWICYLIVSGILIFTRGFLLRKNAFTDSNACIPHSKIPCTPAGSTSVNITNGHEYHCSQQDKLLSLLQDVNSASEICFPKRAKVILLIVDALRHDFTLYNSALKNPYPFQNKLPVIHELLKDENHAKLFKFIADPPTTTMQRLKALTSGSLPTFIDAGSNFATPEINEDNLIDQLIYNHQNVVFMGDDTWLNLYPKRFVRSWPFPSFNVWDLDTVDYGIISQLYTEIPKLDWSLLIAHFLGVDHCGHRYGPYHDEMERKLTEINSVIKKVVSSMDDETMLFVIGDHGMTGTGDHGGASDMEVTSALFIYSPVPLLSLDSRMETVKQIDLIPTLAAILGVPVPFSNLGSIIFDGLPIVNNTKTALTNWQNTLLALWANVKQITNYINRYSATSSQFSKEKLDVLNKQYSILRAKVNAVGNEVHFKSFARDAKQYLTLVRETCEEVWIQFDSFSMSRGLLIVFLTIFFGYMIIDGISGDKLTEIFSSSFIFCSYTVMAAAALFSIVAYNFSLVESFELTLFFSTSIVSFFMLAVLVIQNWELIAIHWYECTKIRQWLDVICRFILLLFVCTLFSNSYVLEDAAVLSHLLLALILFTIYNAVTKMKTNDKYYSQSRKFKWSSPKAKLLLMGLISGVLIRISMHYWRCREEQKWCISYAIGNADVMKVGSTTGKVHYIITLIFLALLVSLTRIWLRSCGNLVGFSPSVTLARYAPTVIVVCTGGFWALHRLPKETKHKLIAPWQANILAWVVYALFAIGTIIVIIQPLCVYVLPKKKETVSLHGYENIIPQIFNHVKGLYQDKRIENADQNDKVPIVYGLGTVYSAVYIIVSILMCLLIALLLGDALAPSSVIMYFTGAVVLTIICVVQRGNATSLAQLVDIPSSSILCWVLLSHYFFYGTSHQPTFPAIQWEAAFVGTGGNIVYNMIPATLIGINTFGSYILFGVTLPLLLIGPLTLSIMFPNWGIRRMDGLDLRRGEMALCENDELLMRGMFSLSCKYILYHGIRIFACMLAATVHCRHLMVWGIFAPKLIFEGLAIMVTLASVLGSYLLLIRIHTAVDNLVANLVKQSR